MKIWPVTLLLLVVGAVSTQNNPPERMPEDVAIFAVLQDGGVLSIDPVVIVHYGGDQRFRTVPAFSSPLSSPDTSEADYDRFETWLYKPGSLVTMFWGGEKRGDAIVQSSNIEGRDGGCVDLSATISYGGTGNPLLATNTTTEIPGHAATRRDATAAETASWRELAIRWLIDYGLADQLLERGQVEPLVSTVLRESAGRALIGRFDVTSKYAVHRLFAIAELDRGQYRLMLVNLEIQHDVEDGTDKTEREYIDQLDINNDGVDEVITTASHYESWSYTVWKFDARQQVWGHAYTGGGGGC